MLPLTGIGNKELAIELEKFFFFWAKNVICTITPQLTAFRRKDEAVTYPETPVINHYWNTPATRLTSQYELSSFYAFLDVCLHVYSCSAVVFKPPSETKLAAGQANKYICMPIIAS